MKGYRYEHQGHIKWSPKSTKLWAWPLYLHDSSVQNSSRLSSLSQVVHFGWAAKPGPSSALHAFFCLNLARIRKKKKFFFKSKKKKNQAPENVFDTKYTCVNGGFAGVLLKCLHSGGLWSLALYIHRYACVYTHSQILFHTRASTTHETSVNTSHTQYVKQLCQDLPFIKC